MTAPATSSVRSELAAPTVVAADASLGPNGTSVSTHKNRYLNHSPKVISGAAMAAHFRIWVWFWGFFIFWLKISSGGVIRRTWNR